MMVSNGNLTASSSASSPPAISTGAPRTPTGGRRSISLTGLGRAEFRAMANEHERWIAEMFGDLSRREVEELLRLLAKSQDVRRAGAVKGARP